MNGRCVAAGLLILASLSARAGHADSLLLTTDENPPLEYMDEQTHEVSGFVTDLVRKVMSRAGVDYRIELLPFSRSYQMALENSGTCIYSMGRPDDRTPLFKWVAPLTNNSWVLLGAPNSTLLIKTLDDAKPLKIGGYQGGKTSYLQSQGIAVDTVLRDEINLTKLLNGRIDVWATSEAAGAEFAKRQGVNNLKKLFVFKEVEMGIACNKSVPDEIIAKLNTALQQIKAAGQ